MKHITRTLIALPRLLSARRHPLRVYAAIELAIGAEWKCTTI